MKCARNRLSKTLYCNSRVAPLPHRLRALDVRAERRHPDEHRLLRPDRARALPRAQVEVVVEEGGRVVDAGGGEVLLRGDGGLEALDAAEDDEEVVEPRQRERRLVERARRSPSGTALVRTLTSMQAAAMPCNEHELMVFQLLSGK